MLNWLFWQVPTDYIGRYAVTLWLVMFVIPPFLFGIKFTMIGFLLNLIWYDIIFYGWYRVKQQIEGDDK
jgi:hypothetical protein